MFNDKERQRKAYLNAIALVKILMAFHGFSINQVKQHYDWTKKDCPTWLRSGKFGYTWSWFKNQLTSATPSTTPTPMRSFMAVFFRKRTYPSTFAPFNLSLSPFSS